MTNFWTSLVVPWLGLHASTSLQESKHYIPVGELRLKKKKKKANFCTENLNSMLKYMVDTGLPLRPPTFRTGSSFLQPLRELVAKSLQLGPLHPSQRSLFSQAKIKNHSILGDKRLTSWLHSRQLWGLASSRAPSEVGWGLCCHRTPPHFPVAPHLFFSSPTLAGILIQHPRWAFGAQNSFQVCCVGNGSCHSILNRKYFLYKFVSAYSE